MQIFSDSYFETNNKEFSFHCNWTFEFASLCEINIYCFYRMPKYTQDVGLSSERGSLITMFLNLINYAYKYVRGLIFARFMFITKNAKTSNQNVRKTTDCKLKCSCTLHLWPIWKWLNPSRRSFKRFLEVQLDCLHQRKSPFNITDAKREFWKTKGESKVALSVVVAKKTEPAYGSTKLDKFHSVVVISKILIAERNFFRWTTNWRC